MNKVGRLATGKKHCSSLKIIWSQCWKNDSVWCCEGMTVASKNWSLALPDLLDLVCFVFEKTEM